VFAENGKCGAVYRLVDGVSVHKLQRMGGAGKWDPRSCDDETSGPSVETGCRRLLDWKHHGVAVMRLLYAGMWLS